MHCSSSAHRYRAAKKHQKMYRPRRDRVFAGVCASIANHYDFSLFGTRLIFILGAIFQFHLAIIGYIVAIFVIPSEGRTMTKKNNRHYPPPPPPPQADAVLDFSANKAKTIKELEAHYAAIEARIEQLEDHVTSKDFILLKKFEQL